MTKSNSIRDISWLIINFEAIDNDKELVKFIDDLSMEEADMLSRAMDAGLCPREPAYITLEAQR